jgi:hypothetical protein
MKILFSEYKNIFNSSKIINYFEDYFKRSDSDYGFYINPKLDIKIFNKIYYHLNKMTYVVLRFIRKLFIENTEFFMDIKKLTNYMEQTKIDLNNLLQKIKNNLLNNTLDKTLNCNKFKYIEEITHISFTDEESKRNDFYITAGDIPKSKNIMIKNIEGEKNNFFISTNEAIYFSPYENAIHTFSLSRLKFNFVMHYKKIDGTYQKMNIPSELIDIAIPKYITYETTSEIEKHKKYNSYNYSYLPLHKT